jgi:hypothetical protein
MASISNTTVLLKKSATPGNVPSTLAYGEVAINYADGKLFYKNSSGSITYISSGSQTSSFATINVKSSLILATSNVDTLNIVGSNGINVLGNTTSKTINIDGSSITSGYTANTVLFANSAGYLNSSNILKFSVSGTPSISAANVLSIGVTPSAWGNYNVIELGSPGNAIGTFKNNQELDILQNIIFAKNIGLVYGVSSTLSSQLSLSNGNLYFYTAPGGFAGSSATLTGVFNINYYGAIGLGSSYSYGNTGQVLTSQGTLSPPTWTTVSSGSGGGPYIITGAQYIDYGFVGQTAGPVQFDYGTL